MDGWLNLLYLVVFSGILILWRPTENNQRYGLDELASEDVGDEELGVMGVERADDKEEFETVFERHADSGDEEVLQWAEAKFGFESEDERRYLKK